MKKNEIIVALEPVIKAFDELGILYYVSGSIASSAYGNARATLDVDLVLNLMPQHIQPFIDRLQDKYYIDKEMIVDALRTQSSFNIFHLDTMLKIDIFILKDKPYSRKAFERKIKDKLEDDQDTIGIYLCSPEDIILNKLEWYKLGGEVSERQWLDILGVIKVQSDNLDKEYLKNWAAQLSVYNLLEEVFTECNLLL
ncbi:MAG: hypothetical protein A2068_08150 [Ignavibacteria bacterium GWB2_35_6b]|nr:MAG: hypothetical protein A2068_08150 [Ignavibacteria bacterium GWB2_35_6b]